MSSHFVKILDEDTQALLNPQIHTRPLGIKFGTLDSATDSHVSVDVGGGDNGLQQILR